ncbi:hypothetical protein ACI2IX_20100 [Leifsonia aquatica]|uniref:hypothetical protein n=1 Tax=Leifsonia aquatica TaxID=144185 RepID=UPI00384EC61B
MKLRTTIAVAALTTATALTLTACVPPQLLHSAKRTPTPTPTSTITAEADELDDYDYRLSLTWAEGADLSADEGRPVWIDPLIADSDWTLIEGLPGNGGWTYKSTINSCHVTFFQGTLSDVDPVAGDDQASTRAVLAGMFQGSWDEVSPRAISYPLNFGMTAATISHKYVVDGIGVRAEVLDGSGEVRVWARSYGNLGVTTYNVMRCESGAELTTVQGALDRFAITVMP